MACSIHIIHRDDCGPCRDARRRKLRKSREEQEASGDFDRFWQSTPKGKCGRHLIYDSDCPACRVEHDHREEWKAARSRHRQRERESLEDDDPGENQSSEPDEWDPSEEPWDSNTTTRSLSGDDWLPLIFVMVGAGVVLWLVIYALSAIGSHLVTLGTAQLEVWGITGLRDSARSSSSSSSASKETAVVRESWSGSVRDGANGRVGGLLMTVEDNTVTSLTMAIDSEGCPKALDLRQPTQIDSSSLRIPIGRQRDEALLKGTFKDNRFEGLMSIGACRLNARVVASPRAE